MLRQDGKSAPRLYWTTLEGSKRGREPYQLENFKLPDLFWSDLADALRPVVATQYSTFQAQEGRFIADQLPPFMTRVHRLLDKSAGRQEWGTIQFILGNALLTFGEQTGTNKPLDEAVAAYRDALKEYARERVPLQWAATHINLGLVLTRLGEREKDTTLMCEALAKQLMAWDVFSINSPNDTTLAVDSAKNTMPMLKNTFESSVYEACVV